MTSPNTANQGPANSGGPNQTAAGLGSALGQVFNSALTTGAQVINAASAGFLGQGINPATQPSNLKTFVYSPEVRVVVAHNEIQYDVSADVVRCTLIRPENSAATFAVTLQNKDLRYTGHGANKPTFSRMDRIVVYMKKTGWTQVFTGYLDTVPYRQLYPGTIDLKATCTIKRLMNTWFNPDLPESQTLLQQTNQPGVMEGTSSDSGLGSLLTRLLVQVGGWDVTNIHVQNFPMSFFTFLKNGILTSQQANAPNVQNIMHLLLGSDTTPGPGAYAGHNSSAGPPGPATPGVGGVPGGGAGVADDLTLFYVSQIVAACDEKGMGPLVSDNNLSAGLAQAGQTGADSGGPMQNPGQQKAWQQVQQTNLDAQQANRNSDAAILGTAAAMTLTGAGTGIRNLCNVAVPGSDQFSNDGPGLTGTTGVGIFALVNAAEWGDVSQRMNPKQAAGMFLAHVAALTGGNWRNMDPGDACAQALRSTSPAPFTAAMQQATKIVQAYRTGSSGTASTTQTVGNTSISTGSSASNIASTAAGAGPGTNPNLVVGAATSAPNPVVNPGSPANPARSTKPNPDSEGAINWAMTQLGKPYEWGGHGPATYDCSGLVSAAFKSIGVYVPAQTDTIRGAVPQVFPNSAVQRGDLVEPSAGHVVLWCGDGTIIEAQQSGVPVHRTASWIGDPSSWTFVGRPCMNGGVDPSAPFNPPETMGPGNPPGALDQQGGAGVGSAGAGDQVGRNLFSYFFTSAFTSTVAQQFGGKKAFMVGAPLLQMVTQICSAGMRCWSSAPNGDFMAWYPDYWGLDGKPCVLRLEDIELTDVHIDFTDDALTTHVYVAGDETFQGTQPNPILQWVDSNGVVTCEDADTWLYQRLIQIAPPDENLSGSALLQRYGIHPLKQTFLMAGDHDLERMLAIKVFMEKWAEQYKTDIQMTFMPELFPGMRVELGGNHNLQVYVTSVTHTCDYEQGFYTTATIMSPSVPMAKRGMAALQTAIGPSAQDLAFADPSSPFGGNADPQGAGV